MIKKKKVCFISSSGGHFEELLALKPIMVNYDSFIITEAYMMKDLKEESGIPIYHIPEINRRDSLLFFRLVALFFRTVCIFIKEKPEVIVTTGALCVLPALIIGYVLPCKIIYIESFARTSCLSATGKLAYKIADRFYVQWENLLNIAPKAIYKGSLK